MFKFKSKKGLVEVTSFALLTSLIIVISLSTYLIVSDIFDDNVAKIDRDNIEIFLKKLDVELSRIETFDSSAVSIPLKFDKGYMTFENNVVTYYSLINFASETEICYSELCYIGVGGYETIYTNLSSPFTYSQSVKLSPNNYILTFTNLDGVDKIEVNYK